MIEKREMTSHTVPLFRNQREMGSAVGGEAPRSIPVSDIFQLGLTSGLTLSWAPRAQTCEPWLDDIAHSNHSGGLVGSRFQWRVGGWSRDAGGLLSVTSFISRLLSGWAVFCPCAALGCYCDRKKISHSV